MVSEHVVNQAPLMALVEAHQRSQGGTCGFCGCGWPCHAVTLGDAWRNLLKLAEEKGWGYFYDQRYDRAMVQVVNLQAECARLAGEAVAARQDALEQFRHLVDVTAERDALRQQVTVMMTPCRCDPLHSGEEYCNGGCELRAELARANGEAIELRLRLDRAVRWAWKWRKTARQFDGSADQVNAAWSAEYARTTCQLNGWLSEATDRANAAETERDAARAELADLRQFHADYSEHTAAAHRVMVEEVEALRGVLASIAEQATQQIDTPLAGQILRQIEQCGRRALEGNS